VSKPTLYAHFGSKGEPVAVVLAARHAARARELRAFASSASRTRGSARSPYSRISARSTHVSASAAVRS
jgi:hypothetical protein